VILVCVVALLSFLSARLGGALVLRPPMVWPLWPGCAFLVAVLLLAPRRTWPVLIAAGLAGFVLYDLQAGLTLRSIAFLILSDTVEVLIAALGVSYALDGLPRLDSTKSLARYSFFAVILAPLPAAFIATAAFGGNYWIRWRIGFFTEALALLTLTPAILGWVSTREAWTKKSRAFYFEAATLIAGLTLLGYFALVSYSGSSLPVLLYSLLPFLLWSALRFGVTGITTSMGVVAFLSIWGAVRGRGPFAGAEHLNNVMSLQLFLFVAATTFLVLAVLVEERKGVERDLRVHGERFRSLYANSTVGLYRTTPGGKVLLANPSLVKMLGFSSFSELSARDLEGEGFEPGYARAEFQRRLASEGEVKGLEASWTKRDGTTIFVRESAKAIRNTEGKIEYYEGTVEDITERKQAEGALRESQQRMAGVVSSAMDAIICVDEKHRILVFNASAEKMFGCPAAEAVGQSVERFIPEQLRSAHRVHVQRFGETGTTNRTMGAMGSLGALRADGEEFQIEASISQSESMGNKLFTVILRDITERQRTEDALRKSEERFCKIFRSSPLAVTISTATEGRYLDVNEAFLQMLGYPRREVIGRTAHDLNFWAEPSQRPELIRQLRKSGRVTGFHTQFTTSKGKIREAEVSAELVELDGQRCMLAITRDITDMRQLEEQLRQAQKMEAVGLLAGGVSHDFNNLLNVILGNTDLLLEKIQPGKPQHYAEEIKNATQRATQLTRQLLAFSRKQVLRPALLDLNGVVGDVVKILGHLIGEDVQTVVEGETNLASIWADRGQVEQILMNLATNARDAMPNGGKFTIRTENAELGPDDVARHPYVVPGRYVRLSVRDTGLGMSDDIRSRAFEPFFTTKPPGRGTGLGLATIYGIVKQSGGYVWISSAVGAGTTFDIYFPRVDEAAPALGGELEAQGESHKGTETILVLEDEESLRELTCEILSGGGYSVLQVGRGGQAIALARQYTRPIHLMVSDVILPDISGPSAVSAVQASHPETKALFVSGYAEGYVVQKVIEAGAILLQKPVSRSNLLREVDEILHLRSPSADGVQSQ
jgi:PAS domain S-box-containing protein